MKRLILIAMIVLLSSSIAMAQGGPCTADFNCDQNVDATDVDTFLSQFGRNPFNDPCPVCYDSPCPCTAPECGPPGQISKTGQTASQATGDDGDLERGVQLVSPRFTDNGDGTITDNQTGLIWMEDANCFGQRTWEQALSDCNSLSAGFCGLTDGSSAGDWGLANRFELESLLHMGYNTPALSNRLGTGQWSEGDPFINVQSLEYWGSTVHALDSTGSWTISFQDGDSFNESNFGTYSTYVWCAKEGGTTTTTTITAGLAAVERTGQATCYDEAGVPRSCAGTGEDGEHQAGV